MKGKGKPMMKGGKKPLPMPMKGKGKPVKGPPMSKMRRMEREDREV